MSKAILACLNGEVLPPAQAMLPATDDGLLRGDGVFEVLRLYGGRPFALEDHLRRMKQSAVNLRLPLDVDVMRADVGRLLGAGDAGEALLRLVATRGGARLSLIEPLPDRPATLRLGLVTYSPTRVLSGVKSLSYAANMLATRMAQERGFDEALLVTPHGRVLEGPTSTFFWVSRGRLLTPPLDEHILASITRDRLMEVTEVEEAPCTRDDVESAEEAFLASTVREVAAVTAIEDRGLPVDGPVTAEAARRLRARIDAEMSAP